VLTGKDIIAMGFAQGPHIPAMIERARGMLLINIASVSGLPAR
jgi:hypothetical protein